MNKCLEMRKCAECGEEKLALIDFPLQKNKHSCKKCNAQRERLRRQKTYGLKPENHWRKRRFGHGPKL